MKRSLTSTLSTFLLPMFLVWLASHSTVLSSQTIDSTEVFSLIARTNNDLIAGKTLALAERLDSLENIQSLIVETDWKISVICALTEIHMSNGNLSKAESFSELGLKTLNGAQGSLPDSIADLTYFLHAVVQLEKGELEAFATYIDSSYQILRGLAIPDPIREARNAIRMSFMTYNQGNLSKTIEWTKNGIDEMLSVEHLSKSDSTQLASLYSNIAFLNSGAGRFDDVIPNYNFALQYDPTLISAYINQAILLRTTQPKRSIELSNQALQYIPQTSYHNRCNAYSNIVSASLVLTETLEDTGHFNIALQYHDSILNMTPYARPNNYPFSANSHGLFADYHSRVAKTRDFDQAWFHLQEQIELLRNFQSKSNTQGLKRMMVSYKERLARLSIMQGDFMTADKSLKEVNRGYHGESYTQEDEFLISSDFLLDNASALHYPLTYISNLMSWSEKVEDPMTMLQKANHIYAIIDSTHDKMLQKNELDIEHLDIDRLHIRGAALAIHMYEHTSLDNHLDVAHERIEKLFSLDLFSNLIRTRLRNSTDAESETYKEKLVIREQIDLLTRQESTESENKTRLDSLNEAYVAVVDRLGTNYKPEKINQSISLDELRQQIGADEVVLYYIHDKMSSTLYGLCISRDTVLPIKQHIVDLESLIYKTNVSLADPNSTNYPEQLQELYKVFMSEISDIIEGKHLIICSMGKLELVPYDLLMDQEKNYLCFNHPIRHLYSAGWSENSTSYNSSGIQGYTSSPNNTLPDIETREEQLGNLNAAREEIAFLKKEFNAKVFVDEKSTKARFKNTADDAAILHLALHGVVNPLEPIRSRLVFGLDGNEDEDLFFHEIDDLNINAQLVTLSACNSGLGNLHGAGSIASLARAFHYAGCPNVVQTLWSVNDETSLQLMKSFYNNLHDGQTIATALSEAKRDFYNSVPQKWKHPYYWGGYVYNGEDISIKIQKESTLTKFLVAGIIIILLLFFILRYKPA